MSVQFTPENVDVREHDDAPRALFGPLGSLVLAGGLASIALAVSFNSTLGALAASITNNANIARSGDALLMAEHQGVDDSGTLLCKSDSSAVEASGGLDGTTATPSQMATCSYNKFGDGVAKLVPPTAAGEPTTVEGTNLFTRNVYIKNLGAGAVKFTVSVNACKNYLVSTTIADYVSPPSSDAGTNLCTKMYVKITGGDLTTQCTGLASALTTNCTDVTVKPTLASMAGVGMTIKVWIDSTADASSMGQKVLQSIEWKFVPA